MTNHLYDHLKNVLHLFMLFIIAKAQNSAEGHVLVGFLKEENIYFCRR